MTRSQVAFASEAIKKERNMFWHQDAVIAHAAVSSAIAASFGKDRGGFARFLSQFKEGGMDSLMEPTAGHRDLTGETIDEGWRDF